MKSMESSVLMERAPIRLLNPFIPRSYDLCITADLDRWSYEAVERIHLVRDPTIPLASQVTLHMTSTISISMVEGGTMLAKNYSRDTVTFQLSEEEMKRGETEEGVNLTIRFSHEMLEELHGFYRVKYRHGGNEYRMASTHFEPTSARRFFICQDEPAARATFSLEVQIPVMCSRASKLTVLSNTPLQRKWEENENIHHRFSPIPDCPPYLIACVIGELECISTVAGTSKIPISVYTTPGKSDQASFALQTSAFALEFFESFFQYPFPLPKLDVVAVPDFPIGGMENWGCICCVETILVNDDAGTSAEVKERVAELLCHEVSHNWFGNLVGIDWWEGLWLKEGFASWCGYFAANAFRPSLNCLETGMRSVMRAKTIDQYDHSHPVEVPIEDPSRITEIFDRISYDKGMGLVFMLESFLGEKWSPAVAHYIRSFSFQGTKTNQLWQALEESSGEQITACMKTFTEQLGFPLVHVERKNSNTVTVRQEPCRLATTSRGKENCKDTLWTIPITIAGPSSLKKMVLSEEGPVNIEIHSKDFPFVVANLRARGFYRIRYDDELFQSLIVKDHYISLDIADRCALLSDIGASIFMGFPDLGRLGALCRVVRQHDSDTMVLKELVSNVISVSALLKENKKLANQFCFEHLSFLIPIGESYCSAEAQKFGEEDAALQIHHSFIIETSLHLITNYYDDDKALMTPLVRWAIEQARNFLRAHSGETGSYRAGTVGACLKVYNRLDPGTTPSERHQELLRVLHSSNLRDERTYDVLTGLCASTHTPFVEDLLLQCIANGELRSQYGGNLFSGACSNASFQKNQLWKFFCRNFDKIKEQWGAGQFRIQVIVECVGATLHGEESAAEFEAFFQEHSLEKAQMAINRTVEKIRVLTWLSSRWSHEELFKAFSSENCNIG